MIMNKLNFITNGELYGLQLIIITSKVLFRRWLYSCFRHLLALEVWVWPHSGSWIQLFPQELSIPTKTLACSLSECLILEEEILELKMFESKEPSLMYSEKKMQQPDNCQRQSSILNIECWPKCSCLCGISQPLWIPSGLILLTSHTLL